MRTIGELAAAEREPVSIPLEAELKKATTLLLLNDFSQLPVMRHSRDIGGMISWKSIGLAQIKGLPNSLKVKDCITPHRLLDHDTHFLDAIQEIITHECIMVKNKKNEIKGPVTLFDLSVEHLRLTQPFTLMGSIEKHLRQIIDCHLPLGSLVACFAEVSSDIEAAQDLTFSQYTRALNEPGLQSLISKRYDLSEINQLLTDINEDRNAIMHFRPYQNIEEITEKLRRAEKFFRTFSESLFKEDV